MCSCSSLQNSKNRHFFHNISPISDDNNTIDERWSKPSISHSTAPRGGGGERSVTFKLVVLRVGGEQHVREELLEAVAGVAGPVLHVRPHRLVELHEELLRGRAQLLDHLVPLVDVLGSRC